MQELTTNATSPTRRRGVAGGVDSEWTRSGGRDRRSGGRGREMKRRVCSLDGGRRRRPQAMAGEGGRCVEEGTTAAESGSLTASWWSRAPGP